MSMDLKNNVLGSLRTAWQSFARLPAALPSAEEGEAAAVHSHQETQGTAILWIASVCVFVGAVCLCGSALKIV